METRVITRAQQVTATKNHQARIEANAWQDDLATLTDAVVRLSQSFERLVVIIEEVRAEDKQEGNEI